MIRALIVNAVTLLNALLGLAAMVALVLGPRLGLEPIATLELAAILITVAIVPDVADGMLARRLGASSEFGAQLDVNADTTTFNLATALLIAVTPSYAAPSPTALGLGFVAALVYAGCGLARSARLLVSAPPKVARGRYFHGATTNLAALATCALVLWLPRVPADWIGPLSLAVCAQALVLGPLMVSRVLFADVAGHLVRGLYPRWPILILVALAPAWGLLASWTAFVYAYGFVAPLVERASPEA